MNKKEFLKELEKRLVILEETERKDIINEYKDTIEEKVKHGQSEEDAVKDFGSIDELSKEILSAYKINFNYKDESEIKSKAKDVVKSTESFIKVGAKRLSDVFRQISDDIKQDKKITLEFVFEIILKVLIFLVICSVLRIPFWLLERLGVNLLEIFFPPLSTILIVIWFIIVYCFYFISVIIIGITMFKEYFNNIENKETEEKKIPKGKEKVKKINEEPQAEKISEKVTTSKVTNNLSSAFKTLTTILILIFFLIPLWFINIGLLIALTFFLYLLIRGVMVIGIIFILIGIIIIFSTITEMIYRLTFTKKKIHFYPLIISMFLIFMGSIYFTFEVADFEYYDKAPSISYVKKENGVYLNADKNRTIRVENGRKEIIIDNSIEDNKILVVMSYYDEFTNYTYNESVVSNNNYVTIYSISRKYKLNRNKKILNIIIDDLEKKEINNYTELFKVDVKVYVNEKNRDKVK